MFGKIRVRWVVCLENKNHRFIKVYAYKENKNHRCMLIKKLLIYVYLLFMEGKMIWLMIGWVNCLTPISPPRFEMKDSASSGWATHAWENITLF